LPCLAERLRAGCQAVAAGYDGDDEADFLIVAQAPTPGAPPALSAFLRGVGRRALLFAALQAGEGPAVDAALARATARFATGAADLPMGAWPSRFWSGLLAGLPRPDAPGVMLPAPALPGFDALAAPGSGARTALLLALVAGLDEDDGGAALGVDASTWRLALRRAAPRDAGGGFDEAAWRSLAAAARDAQRDLPEARLAWWEHVALAALATRAAGAVSAAAGVARAAGVGPDAARRRRTLRLLWAGVGACLLALAATFLPWYAWFSGHGGANPAPAQAIPLAPADAPGANYDAAFALRHHPDLARLLAGEDALLRELDFGAWYAARRASGDDAADAAATDADATDAGAANGGAAAGDAAGATAQPLPAFDALSPAQRAELERRVAVSDALPRAERGALRERWDAWQRLPAAERDAVRHALAEFAALPADARQPLRDGFAAQPGDLQRGWLLGPTLGARWPQLQPLLQQVPADEREPLLARLHAMDAAALDALGEVARRTPPQSREALRRRLLRNAAGAAGAA
jgi:hypothetical protein